MANDVRRPSRGRSANVGVMLDVGWPAATVSAAVDENVDVEPVGWLMWRCVWLLLSGECVGRVCGRERSSAMLWPRLSMPCAEGNAQVLLFLLSSGRRI